MPSLAVDTPRRRFSVFAVVLLLLLLLLASRALASYAIELAWWREMNQLETFFTLLLYGVLPVAVTALVAFALFWVAHARGMKAAGTGLRQHRLYARLATLALLVVAVVFSLLVIDSWTVVQFFGSRGLAADGFRDPAFGRPLSFYLFDLPFYSLLLRVIRGMAVATALLYWLTHRGWALHERVRQLGPNADVEINDLRLGALLESRFARGLLAVFLLALAVRFYLDRYAMVLNDHGFLVGVDYVDEHIRIPLVWLAVVSAVVAAVAVLLGRLRWLVACVAVLVLQAVVPSAVNAFYVRPNEVTLQRPYLERHLAATRAAYGLDAQLTERDYGTRLNSPIDPAAHQATLDNVRLWDWRAFHDTVTQIQALRPYYVFHDSDVDRYTLDGQLRQVLLTPRELDVNQLADGRTRWINSHFVYTHGYGLVMAEANEITTDGLPVMLIQNAPPEVKVPSLRVTRPELYYGEVTHEPVFVRTGQPEFNYPSGSENVHTRYEGKGGFPIAGMPMRLAASLTYGDGNMLLTSYLTGESRMMIRRRVRDRLEALAGFLDWDPDPYLVLTPEGRQVWIVDGYTHSDAHPYSRLIRMQGFGELNYMRNSVKATVDAYDGTVTLYVFDAADPILGAYRRLLPGLFQPREAMPAALLEHVRYPETLFSAQAEIYRAFHMRDPEQFYNREDLWDIPRSLNGPASEASSLQPVYVVATLPGETRPEFLLLLPFTPRGKDNMIGLMAARCDGPRLGELVVLRLSKQDLVFGPMQIEARINQDQNISKDLTLWNQQGSQVLRGQMLVLPVGNTFLYVEPIYIQSSQSRMPQLKKVVLAAGNRLLYADTYEAALAQLGGETASSAAAADSAPQTTGSTQPAVPPAPATGDTLSRARLHFRRYRELASQGRWAEAGRELEALQAVIGN